MEQSTGNAQDFLAFVNRKRGESTGDESLRQYGEQNEYLDFVKKKRGEFNVGKLKDAAIAGSLNTAADTMQGLALGMDRVGFQHLPNHGAAGDRRGVDDTLRFKELVPLAEDGTPQPSKEQLDTARKERIMRLAGASTRESNLARAARDETNILRQAAAEIAPHPSDSFAGSLAENVASSAPHFAAGIAIATTVGPVAGAGYFAATEGGAHTTRVYEDLIARGADPDRALEAATNSGVIYAAVSGVLERVGLSKVVKGKGLGKAIEKVANSPKWRGMLARIGAAGLTEGGTEVLQGMSADALLGYATDDWGEFKDRFTRSDVSLQEFMVGGLMGGGVRGAFEVVEPSNYRTFEAWKADQQSEIDKAGAQSDSVAEGQEAPSEPGTAPTTGIAESGLDGNTLESQGVAAGSEPNTIDPGATPSENLGVRTLLKKNGVEDGQGGEIDTPTDTHRGVEGRFAKYGIKVRWVDGGRPLAFPGAHSARGEIVLDARMSNEKMMNRIAWHEAVHDLQVRNPTQAADLLKDLEAAYPGISGTAMATYAENSKRAAEEAGEVYEEMSEEDLLREAAPVIAEQVIDSLVLLSKTPGAIDQIMAQQPKLLERMIGYAQSVLRAMGKHIEVTKLERARSMIGAQQNSALIANRILEAMDEIDFGTPQDAQTNQKSPATPVEQTRQPSSSDDAATPVDAQPAAGDLAPRVVLPRNPVRSEFKNRDIRRRLEGYAREAGFDQIVGSNALSLEGLDADQFASDHVDLNFSGPLPAEINEALSGANRSVRSMFRANVPKGTGSDTMAAIGADEMVRRAKLAAERGEKGMNDFIERTLSDDQADVGMLRTVAGLREGRSVRDLAPIEVVDEPFDLPDGATFEIEGSEFVVYTAENSAKRASDGQRDFNLGIEAMPITKGSLDKKAGAEVAGIEETADTIGGIPFAVNPRFDDPVSASVRDELGLSASKPIAKEIESVFVTAGYETAMDDRAEGSSQYLTVFNPKEEDESIEIRISDHPPGRSFGGDSLDVRVDADGNLSQSIKSVVREVEDFFSDESVRFAVNPKGDDSGVFGQRMYRANTGAQNPLFQRQEQSETQLDKEIREKAEEAEKRIGNEPNQGTLFAVAGPRSKGYGLTSASSDPQDFTIDGKTFRGRELDSSQIKFADRLWKKYARVAQRYIENPAKFKSGTVTGSLDTLIEWADLFDAYPGFRDIDVRIEIAKNSPEGGSLSFFPSNVGKNFKPHDTILRIAIPPIAESYEGEGTAHDPMQPLDSMMKNTVVHELQHAIALVEDWPKGSNLPGKSAVATDLKRRFGRLPTSNEIFSARFGIYYADAGERLARAASRRQPLTAKERQRIPFEDNIETAEHARISGEGIGRNKELGIGSSVQEAHNFNGPTTRIGEESGVDLPKSKKEVPVEDLMPKSEGYVPKADRGNKDAGASGRQGTFFAVAPPVKSHKFRKWFGDSKVVDEQGKPLVMYHGTGTEQEFNKFDGQATGGVGFYFTSEAEEASWYAQNSGMISDSKFRIVPTYLRVNNPATAEQWSKGGYGGGGNPRRAARIALMEQGYDGVVFRDDNGRVFRVIAFEPNQIKSTTGNTGEFDPSNPDIRFAVGDSRKSRVGFTKDSKVKKVVYHATSAEEPFNEFDPEKSDMGIHFGTEEQANRVLEIGRGGGSKKRIIPAYIDLQSPLRLKDTGSFHGWAIADQLLKKGIIDKQLAEQVEDGDWQQERRFNPIVRDAIIDAGYDGIVYKNTTEGEGDSYILFQANQIKSATGNSGEFSMDNPDIRFAVSEDNAFFDGLQLPDKPPTKPSRRLQKLIDKTSTEDMFNGIDPSEGTMLDMAMFRLRRNQQDKFLIFKRAQDNIKKSGRAISEEANVYRSETLYYGRAAEKGRRLQKDRIDPIYSKMAENEVTLAELDEYLIALHAPERNAHIKVTNPKFEGDGSGMSNEKAERIVHRVNRSDKAKIIKELATDVAALREWTLDYMVENDLVAPQQAAAWREAFKHYVPLRTNDNGSRGLVRGRGFEVRGPESKRAKGRRSQADSPLIFMIMQAESAIVRAERNRIGLSFMKLIQQNPDPTLWRVVKPTVRKVTTDNMWSADEVAYEENPQAAEARRDENTVVVKEGGEERYLVLSNADLARGFKNLGTSQMSVAMRNLAQLMRIKSMMLTSLSPEFVMTNFIRDIQTAGFNIQSDADLHSAAAKTLKNTPAAVRGAMRSSMGEHSSKDKETTRWSKAYREFVEDGAKTGWAAAHGFDERVRELQKVVNSSTKKAHITKRLAIGAAHFVEDLNTAVENGVRLSFYMTLREDHGKSRAEAAELAKNLTVNFNRRGEAGTFMNTLYLFYNAGIQGNARMLAATTTSRGSKVAASMVGASFALGLLNGFLSDEDDDGVKFYDKMSSWEKSHNLIIMIPGRKGGAIKLPLPYGYNLFHSIGINAASFARGEQSAGESLGHMGATFMHSFSPLGGGFGLADLAPEVIKPFVEVGLNEVFTGAQMRPERYGNDTSPDSQMYFSDSTLASRKITSTLNSITGGNTVEPGLVDISPETLDHFSSWLGGSTGRFLMETLVDIPTRIASGEGIDVRGTPFLRRLVTTESRYRHERDYWSNRKVAGELLFTEGAYFKAPSESEDFVKFQSENDSLLAASREFNLYHTVIKNLRDRQDEGDASVTDKLIESYWIEANGLMNAASKGEDYPTPLLDESDGIYGRRRNIRRAIEKKQDAYDGGG